MKNLSDSKQNQLSEEELLELSKINSDRNVIVTRFFEQNLVFRCAAIFVVLSAGFTFVFFRSCTTLKLTQTTLLLNLIVVS